MRRLPVLIAISGLSGYSPPLLPSPRVRAGSPLLLVVAPAPVAAPLAATAAISKQVHYGKGKTYDQPIELLSKLGIG